ncbi:SixA phosphatase family protein [Ignavibacterium album]|uniref:SixA phosphatase family protein n=1 Tax=Ignavibacterium album TaxID=591197 RepID=UPI0035B78723
MRQLILIRHAKSSWSNPDLSDFDRPLNKRGKRDLAFMSVLLSQKNMTPELIISSPALRTKLTAIEFANKIGYNKNEIIWNKNLYLASYMNILKIIKQIENKINCAIIVGHNPGLTDLQNYLCNEEIDNIPTSGIVSKSTIKEWKDVESKDFELVFFEFPKKYLKKI